MNCKHERLRTVGDRVFCCACNEELPLAFLIAKNGENSQEEKTEKPRKRAAKKSVKEE